MLPASLVSLTRRVSLVLVGQRANDIFRQKKGPQVWPQSQDADDRLGHFQLGLPAQNIAQPVLADADALGDKLLLATIDPGPQFLRQSIHANPSLVLIATTVIISLFRSQDKPLSVNVCS